MNAVSQPMLTMSLCTSAPLKSEEGNRDFEEIDYSVENFESTFLYCYFFRQTKLNDGYIFLMHCEFYF